MLLKLNNKKYVEKEGKFPKVPQNNFTLSLVHQTKSTAASGRENEKRKENIEENGEIVKIQQAVKMSCY